MPKREDIAFHRVFWAHSARCVVGCLLSDRGDLYAATVAARPLSPIPNQAVEGTAGNIDDSPTG